MVPDTQASSDTIEMHNVNNAYLAQRSIGQSSLVAKNVRIDGRRTSMRLEPEYWDVLRAIARHEGRSVGEICSRAARNCVGSVTSSVRVYILKRIIGGHFAKI